MNKMKAMVLNAVVDMNKVHKPLALKELEKPVPEKDEVLLKVLTCGVCHTELDEIEGRTPPPFFPVILGHQVIGIVEECGKMVHKLKTGMRVGVGWIFSACGKCAYCKAGMENLCEEFKATGRDAHGGYAEYMTVPARYAYPIPSLFSDAEAAPLLCAGGTGFRSLRLCNLKNGQRLGLTGFGASGHLVLMAAQYLYPDSKIFVFARSAEEREFALELGASWAGDTTERSPVKLHAIIDTTPVWKPVVHALINLLPGGRLVINAIRKEGHDQEELLHLDYERHLWMEKEIKSVANVTRKDIIDFLKIAEKIPIRPEVQEYPLEEANKALMELKNRQIRGAKVLRISH